MAEKRRSGTSLSTRVTVLTLLAVTLSVAVISLVSVGGVYNLTRSEDASRLFALRRLIADDLSGRFTYVDRVVDALASEAASESAVDAGLQALVALGDGQR